MAADRDSRSTQDGLHHVRGSAEKACHLYAPAASAIYDKLGIDVWEVIDAERRSPSPRDTNTLMRRQNVTSNGDFGSAIVTLCWRNDLDRKISFGARFALRNPPGEPQSVKA